MRDVVLEELRRQIIDGRLAPGDHLVETQLADRFDVSRNPVREAIRALEGEGFVEIIPRRGAVVATLTSAQVRDVFELRGALDPLAAGLAAERATRQHTQHLRRIADRAEAALEAADAALLSDLNNQFHGLIVRASGNETLVAMALQLQARMAWILSHTPEYQTRFQSLDEHDALVDAIERGDADGACRVARSHVLTAERDYWRVSATGHGADQAGTASAGSSGPM